MTYVALLRGINVGGNNIIKMDALRECIEAAGCERARTYIASGNVIFDSRETSAGTLTKRVESAIANTFGITLRTVVLSRPQLAAVVKGAPREWARRSDIRRNVAFLRRPVTGAQAMKSVEVQPGVDEVRPGAGVLYMS